MNNNTQSGVTRIIGLEYGAGVGGIMGATLPKNNSTTPVGSGNGASASAQSAGVYSGPFAQYSFLNEPFAVWLGMVLVLMLLKFLSESPKTSINPAKLEVGGYNWITIGVSAATFITLFKVIFNRVQIPGLTEFANAL